MRIALATLALPLSLGLAACSSKVADRYPTIESFCQAKAAEECQVAPRCAVTVEACAQDRAASCLASATTTIQTTGRTYVAPNAPACIDAVHRVYAQGMVPPTELDVTRDGSMAKACDRVLLGSADRNEKCTVDADCMLGRICSAAIVGTATRVCADPVVKAKGEFCADPGSVCEDGTFCSTAMGAPICAPRAELDEACTPSLPCVEGLRCNGSGRCSARLPAGATCVSNDDCAAEAPMCDRAAGWVCDVGLSFAPPPSTTCIGYGR